MTKKEFYELSVRLASVSVFANVAKSEPLRLLTEYLESSADLPGRMRLYAGFVSSLSEYDGSFSEFLKKAVLCDENVYTKNRALKKAPPAAIEANAKAELELFSALTRIRPEELCTGLEGYHAPVFENTPTDMTAEYEARIRNIKKYGFGVFSQAVMFRLENGGIVPVKSADRVDLSDFIGYDEERRKVVDNVKALIEGRPYANALLYGDAGTGKSSTVKACANHFANEGLRLIELRKDQLLSLPYVIEKIRNDPLKFIIFTDDLSFSENDDSFGMLKAALEGSSSSSSDNAMIIATSNRRHVVKEKFSDRDGDDVHRSDTMEELTSLSDRFGLRVYFGKPDKARYLEIVKGLADRYGVCDPELDKKAEAFALAKGSRSPRTAEQFIKLFR